MVSKMNCSNEHTTVSAITWQKLRIHLKRLSTLECSVSSWIMNWNTKIEKQGSLIFTTVLREKLVTNWSLQPVQTQWITMRCLPLYTHQVRILNQGILWTSMPPEGPGLSNYLSKKKNGEEASTTAFNVESQNIILQTARRKAGNLPLNQQYWQQLKTSLTWTREMRPTRKQEEGTSSPYKIPSYYILLSSSRRHTRKLYEYSCTILIGCNKN